MTSSHFTTSPLLPTAAVKSDTLSAQELGLGFKVPRMDQVSDAVIIHQNGGCGLGEFEEQEVLDYKGIDLGSGELNFLLVCALLFLPLPPSVFSSHAPTHPLTRSPAYLHTRNSNYNTVPIPIPMPM